MSIHSEFINPHSLQFTYTASAAPHFLKCSLEAFLISTGIVALAEIGDKTQVATVALAAQFNALFAVVAGTTLGMMIANVPAVLLGNRIAQHIPVRLAHGIAALIFCAARCDDVVGCGSEIWVLADDQLFC